MDEDGPDGNAPAMLRHAPDLLRMGERAQLDYGTGAASPRSFLTTGTWRFLQL
jgi:hypothetical protein